jgi:CysZ protein
MQPPSSFRESSPTVRAAAGGGLRDLLDGAACLVRGLRITAATPSLWALGLMPALLALVVLVGLLVALAVALPAIVAALTPFANGWSAADRDSLRLLVGLAIVIGAGWLALISYAALAVAIGQPFYEAISRRIDEQEGGIPARDDRTPPRWRVIARASRDGLLLAALSACLSVALFALGLVPLAGQTLGPVLGVCAAGYLIAVELTSVAFERRGIGLRERLGLLWRRRLLTLGFGLAALVLFLVPFGAVVGMPGAIAGGTLLARRLPT